MLFFFYSFFFFQAEDGIRDVERSRGLGDVYKRQVLGISVFSFLAKLANKQAIHLQRIQTVEQHYHQFLLAYVLILIKIIETAYEFCLVFEEALSG
eukprot:TRINITY_DN16862_c0_g1_i2.p2 TRINITY_DN16862_c0_g1~~TRINITY_DN16862_c0_g1_i2.p2  ORF type:complete len:105 (+),score=21.10 TRINITY_DN16862_c0_g1_i2:29-316(+)